MNFDLSKGEVLDPLATPIRLIVDCQRPFFMKKVILLVACMSLVSCENKFLENDFYLRTETIDLDISIRNSETYEYDLGLFGLNEGTELEIKGNHFEMNKLNRDHEGRILYRYKAQFDYVGSDFVIIATGSNYSDGMVSAREAFIRLFLNLTD